MNRGRMASALFATALGLLAAGVEPARACGGGGRGGNSWTFNLAIDMPVKTQQYVVRGQGPQPRLTGIQLEAVPEDGADKAAWRLRFINGLSRRVRVTANLSLLDSSNNAAASVEKVMILLPLVDGADERIEMELPPGAWKKAAKLQIALHMKKI